MNPKHSKAIYKVLNNGSVVNKYHVESGQKLPNPLYTDIVENEQMYKDLYRYIGLELHHIDGAYMVRDLDSTEHTPKPAMRIMVVIDLLAKALQEMSLHPEIITEPAAGLDLDKLSAFDSNSDFNDILKVCDIKGSLTQEIKNNLVGRAIATINDSGRFVLNESGKVFYEALHNEESITPLTHNAVQ